MEKTSSHAAAIAGAAVMAGGLIGGAGVAQAQDNPAPLYPTPEFPTCIAKAPTDCRLSDGHPDLTGLWRARAPHFGDGGGNLASGASEQVFGGRGGTFVGFESDGGLFRQTRAAEPGMQPHYKPQYWDKIIESEYNGNFEDPHQRCWPYGVPRLGPPDGILALQKQPWVQLVYASTDTPGIKIRMVPTDGRDHNVTNVASETWNGDPVGHWEGDTLVVESIGFTDGSWLEKSGFIHGFDMKVTEKFTRDGNKLTYQTTVEDPEYFVEPWVQNPVTRDLVMDPNATLFESLPCSDIDSLHTTSHTRSG